MKISVIGLMFAALAATALGQGAGGTRDDAWTAPKGLTPTAARLYTIVKKPHAGELRWQQIPWLVDLPEAMRQAREEKRPLLLWVSGDDPLEKC